MRMAEASLAVEQIKRVTLIAIGLTGGAWLVYRGNVYSGGSSSLLGPAMAVISGLLLIVTTFAWIIRLRSAK